MSVFTPEEVISLNEYQNSGVFHPFTCGSDVRTEHEDGEGLLVATESGWYCPYCSFRQNWAHSYMKDGSWKQKSPWVNYYRLNPIACNSKIRLRLAN